MYNITIYGRDVAVRSRFWFGPFHCVMQEVCACEPDGSRIPLAVFYAVDDAWKYIANAGHRVRNGRWLLMSAIEENKLSREMDDLRREFEKSMWSGGVCNG